MGETEPVAEESVVCVGFSAPRFDETTTVWTSPAEDEWINLQYPQWTLEQALVELLGQTDVGAELPWEDASAFLLKHIEPDSVQLSAGSILSVDWLVFAQSTFVMSVPGRPVMRLDSEQ